MSEKDEHTSEDGDEQPPEPQAHFQHFDSPHFPTDTPGAEAEEMGKLSLWVSGYLVPTWVYEISSDKPWCLHWQEHPDAVSMLHATYRAYQELINTEMAGLASPSTWMHHHLLPALAYLRRPEGPFARCVRGPRQIEHALPESAPWQE